MRPSTRRTLVWTVLGTVCYVAGALFVLVVLIGAYVAPPDHSLQNLSRTHLPFLLLGVVLLVLGKYIHRRYIREFAAGSGEADASMQDRPQSVLREYGHGSRHRSPSDDPGVGVDDGEYVRCAECGAENERGFTYCRNCSGELPG